MTKIAIIIGSTRPGRKGETVAQWALDIAKQRGTAEYEIVDLLDYQLPHLDEVLPAAMGQYAQAHTKRWAEKVAEFDGFVFVTPEYNHSVPGPLKNAIDFVGSEWNNKAAGFIGYGAVSGVRAVEQLRLILSNLQIAHVTNQVALSLFTDFENMSEFKPAAMHTDYVNAMLDQVEAWSTALATLRTAA